jgi:integrase
MLYGARHGNILRGVPNPYNVQDPSMAHLRQDPRTSNWLIYFRYGGSQFSKSCETKNRRTAEAVKARVDDTICLLKQGRVQVPDECENIGHWIFTDRKLDAKPRIKPTPERPQLEDVCKAYTADQRDKAKNTLDSERKHIGHLTKILGAETELDSITTADLQSYVKKREKQTHHDRNITGATIKKELATLRQVWAWARHNDKTERSCPIYGKNGDRKWAISLTKSEEKGKFQTWAEIEKKIARGGLEPDKIAELWAGVFLDDQQVVKLLKHVEKHAVQPFIYPMLVFAAYTGARRSELLRSEADDFDFAGGQVRIRERKRRRDRASTFRSVPMHSKLRAVMQEWIDNNPKGQHTFTLDDRALRPFEAHVAFKRTLRGSKWKVLPGFHVLRHSFGSNLARSGRVNRDTIGQWMGHSTEEMKAHYMHLFPQDGAAQIEVLT